MAKVRRLFTSESVTAGHSDKYLRRPIYRPGQVTAISAGQAPNFRG